MRRTSPKALRHAGLSVTAVAGLALSALAAAPAADAQQTAPAPHGVRTVHSCSTPKHVNWAACDALKVTGGTVSAKAVGRLTPLAAPSGYGPAQLQAAYKLPSGGGAGATVAIVDAYDNPNAEKDLAAYRSQFGLPACTSANGCFKKVGQTGSTTSLPTADAGWAEEESLDVDMVSAIAPGAHIILVEANSSSMGDLGASVNEAVKLGAKYVSNSYGGGESSSDSSYDSSYFNHPGVAITVSSGDSGYGVEYPAASKYVTAVGGTSLKTASNSRGWSESAWSGAGSGCSKYDTKPSWQKDTGCTKRTVADVSAVADPSTGVAVYDTYGGDPGWEVFGGTSVSAPIIAAVYADAGTPSAGSTPASFPYAHTSSLFDVTSGSNGSCGGTYLCSGKTGYDGPTGLGTPNGLTAFKG
ncbi:MULTISPECIES: S53 family peptidase [Streptomycetaceae]|uniref:Protease-like protein n=1 Tax=Streptantibioticus cattleyicolor (strain ATCC 35852 / DSM 46488 / JCM 4925 / NBRC 14057 / NRRL 8057) TaxID=1003195 RepID=F8JZU9_STREN|nr:MULTISPECIES: S53 family peptidase [Streptomycetaceae]AEW93533.1 protease-like protein [Streptantibioticus cattleyicolor NRRL 8057 = DSM 46488]MYS58241.1 peptidase S8 [Streptomyces sp. SID5468]CCB73883.1 Protease [Streptantibioticus cattleyicolor NRRL 8057 = DSM 46488]